MAKSRKGEQTGLYSGEWPIVGHSWAVEYLTQSLNHGRIRHAYLIAGPSGIGKTTLARALAQAVNCLDEHKRPCGACRACRLIAQNSYADVDLIEADGDTLKIEQVRDMQHSLSLLPVEARYRVIILRHFHKASPQAMDALLKTLEEPPPYVLLLLTADTTDSLLPTIRSRCQPLNLRLLPPATIRQALEKDRKVAPEQAALLAQLSGGRMGWAVRAAADETLLADRNNWLAKLEESLSLSRAGRFALAEPLSKDKSALLALLETWQSYWRDALLLAHSTTIPITNRDRRHALEQIAVGIRVEDIHHILVAIRRTTRYIEQNVNARLALEVLMLDLPRLRLLQAPPG